MALDPAAVEETFEVLALEVKLGMVHGDRGGWEWRKEASMFLEDWVPGSVDREQDISYMVADWVYLIMFG